MAEQKTLLERWKEHPTRRKEFAALLQEPTMQDALAIVRERIFSPSPLAPPGPHLIEWYALLGRVREGYLEMLTNFLSLADVSPFNMQERKPWATPDYEKAKAALRQELGVGTAIPADSPASKPPDLTVPLAPTPGDATPPISPNPQSIP